MGDDDIIKLARDNTYNEQAIRDAGSIIAAKALKEVGGPPQHLYDLLLEVASDNSRALAVMAIFIQVIAQAFKNTPGGMEGLTEFFLKEMHNAKDGG